MLSRIVLLLALGAFSCVAVCQETVAEYSGNGLSNTRPFTVQDGWEIQWNANGDIFQIYIYDMYGALIGVAANQMGPGSGNSFSARGGTYYLQVNAMGPWSTRIVQLPASASPRVAAPLEIEGDGARYSRPFQMPGPWEIQWAADGDIFQVYIYSTNGDLVGIAANQMGPGNGSSFQPLGGDYYLQVNAIGWWKVRLVPLD